MSRRDQEELLMIERSITLDEDKLTVNFKYPYVKDPSVLTDNKSQAILMALGLERKLKKSNGLYAYYAEFKSYIDQGVIMEISYEEINAWQGGVNYIAHRGVVKPGLMTTKLRIVSNSSLNNNIS